MIVCKNELTYTNSMISKYQNFRMQVFVAYVANSNE